MAQSGPFGTLKGSVKPLSVPNDPFCVIGASRKTQGRLSCAPTVRRVDSGAPYTHGGEAAPQNPRKEDVNIF